MKMAPNQRNSWLRDYVNSRLIDLYQKLKIQQTKICINIGKTLKKSFEEYYTQLFAEPYAIDLSSEKVFLTSLKLPLIGSEHIKDYHKK